MNNLSQSVDLLEVNVSKLLSRHSALQQSFEHLLKEKENLLIKISEQEKEISDLEEKLDTSRIANAIVGSKEDKHVTKLKINTLVREIDKCIAQLSE
jgi:predicted  nucleic acid-binding Zn-ribbon protein